MGSIASLLRVLLSSSIIIILQLKNFRIQWLSVYLCDFIIDFHQKSLPLTKVIAKKLVISDGNQYRNQRWGNAHLKEI